MEQAKSSKSLPHLDGLDDLMDLAHLRQVGYRLFGAVFLYPDEERLTRLVAAAGELQEESEPLAAFSFFGEWQKLLTALQDLALDETAEKEVEYTRLFLVKPQAPPYESSCLDPERRVTGWILAQLEQEYEQAGLTISSSFGESPDHVAVELEFMAFLCSKEGEAWAEDQEQGIRYLERQRDFLDKHLGQWFPLFAARVREVAPESLYAVAIEAAEAFIRHDIDLINLLMEEMGEYE